MGITAHWEAITVIPIYFTLDHSVMKAVIKKVLQNGRSAKSEVTCSLRRVFL